jgi:hypothetical protein
MITDKFVEADNFVRAKVRHVFGTAQTVAIPYIQNTTINKRTHSLLITNHLPVQTEGLVNCVTILLLLM